MKLLWYAMCSLFITQTKVKGCIYDGFKVYELTSKIHSSALDLYRMVKNESQYVLLSGRGTIVMVHPEAQAEFLYLLENNQWEHRVLNQDVGLDLSNAFETNRNLSNLYPYKGHAGTDRYYTFDEINRYIEDLAQQYPSRVFVKTVGKSYEGRTMKTIRITNGDGRANKNVILIDGGIHAREWIAHAAVLYAIGELSNNYQKHAQLLQDYDWVILPVVNPDGYEFTQLSADNRFWRKTRQPINESCIGTDGNRNFDFHWNETGAYWDPCSTIYPGPKAFSEPETIVMRDLIQSLAGRGKMYLTLHSYGQYILYPYGYTNALPVTWRDLEEVARAGANAIMEATGTRYKVGCSGSSIYPIAGASDDYAFNAGFPISFTMELPPGGANKFDPPASDIDRLVKEAWVGIEAMARKVIQKYPLKESTVL
ncbi:carboxypeptidase B1-like [Drosophila nasuta]|uniref:carboxypeptidase B1-like n=1 Tax=Drosophila nasuta TaxID=42062 RepID=UPI00295EE997|nr:carboxypeptidase B1-like [Drosophila nasuta]